MGKRSRKDSELIDARPRGLGGFGASILDDCARRPMQQLVWDSDLSQARKQALGQIPVCSGVYGWLNSDGTIVYIGKAKSLRHRPQVRRRRRRAPQPPQPRSRRRPPVWTRPRRQTSASRSRRPNLSHRPRRPRCVPKRPHPCWSKDEQDRQPRCRMLRPPFRSCRLTNIRATIEKSLSPARAFRKAGRSAAATGMPAR